MPDDQHDAEPTQTTPKGAEIPVPTRDAVLRDLMKAAPKAPAKGEAMPDKDAT